MPTCIASASPHISSTNTGSAATTWSHIAAHGFEAVELFATRAHFDYHDPSASRNWLNGCRTRGSTLHSIHAPIVEAHAQRRMGRFVLESRRRREPPQGGRRRGARRRSPSPHGSRSGTSSLHLGIPTSEQRPHRQSADAARRSVEEIVDAARRASNVRVALEVIPNALSERRERSSH